MYEVAASSNMLEVAESTNVTTEVSGDKELRLSKVGKRPTPQAQEIKSQLGSSSPEDLQNTAGDAESLRPLLHSETLIA
jgi:antitoxin component of MazEF toxin-antitoxin module